MKRRLSIASILVASIAMVAGLSLFAATPALQAEDRVYSNADLVGGYAFQAFGSHNFPPEVPFSVLNGPFANNGRIWFNGQGQMKMQHVYNFNGQIIRVKNDGTYHVNRDGTFTVTYVFQQDPFPPLTLTFDGVLAKDGNEGRAILSGFSAPGVPLPPGYVGSTIVVTMTKQSDGGHHD